MWLSDRDIRAELERGELIINPLAEGAVQPASVDVRFSGEWRRQYQEDDSPLFGAVDDRGFVAGSGELWLFPGDFVLSTTMEHVEVPPYLGMEIAGKSSWARKGVQIHVTGGLVDPGFRGVLVIEIKHLGQRPELIRVGDFIGQLKLTRLSSPVEHPYRGRYQDQRGVQGPLPPKVVR